MKTTELIGEEHFYRMFRVEDENFKTFVTSLTISEQSTILCSEMKNVTS